MDTAVRLLCVIEHGIELPCSELRKQTMLPRTMTHYVSEPHAIIQSVNPLNGQPSCVVGPHNLSFLELAFLAVNDAGVHPPVIEVRIFKAPTLAHATCP